MRVFNQRFGVLDPRVFLAVCLLGITMVVAASDRQVGNASANQNKETVKPPATVAEARERAKLMHETVHLLLQAVHRDLFNDEEANAIPSRSFEDVFESLADRHSVSLQWLVVETDVVNVDHVAESEFDQAAVAALRGGARSYESATANRYERVGAIDLPSQCLKCHVKNRTSLETRTAGLRISMPIGEPDAKKLLE